MPLPDIILVVFISVNLLIIGLRCINGDSGGEGKKRKEKSCIVTRIEKTGLQY